MSVPSYAGLHKPSMSFLLTCVRAVEAATPPPVCRAAAAPSSPAAHFASAHVELIRTVGGGDSARRASIRRVDLDSSAPSIDSTVCCSIRRRRTSICTAGGCLAAKLARTTCCSPLPCGAAAEQAGSHRPELLPGEQRKGVAAADTTPLDLRRGGRLQLDDLSGFRRPFFCASLQLASYQLAPTPLSWRMTMWWSRSSRSRGVAVKEQGREE
jgi:hypothetical protein